MREIKFKAWDKIQNCIIDCDDLILKQRALILPTGLGFAHIDEDGFFDPIETLIPMQYTGLKDKNGKEIYEGDIVDVGVEEQPDNICIIEKVPNSHGMTTFIIKHPRRGKYGGTGYPEVIGNIYENPELLNNTD